MTATVTERDTLKVGLPKPITTEEQYDRYVEILLSLDRKHHLSLIEKHYADVLAHLIANYDEKHNPIPDASAVEVLESLMEANDLRQKDLALIFGTVSVLSEILNGKRELNIRHIIGLSKRFHVSPAVFLPVEK